MTRLALQLLLSRDLRGGDCKENDEWYAMIHNGQVMMIYTITSSVLSLPLSLSLSLFRLQAERQLAHLCFYRSRTQNVDRWSRRIRLCILYSCTSESNGPVFMSSPLSPSLSLSFVICRAEKRTSEQKEGDDAQEEPVHRYQSV